MGKPQQLMGKALFTAIVQPSVTASTPDNLPAGSVEIPADISLCQAAARQSDSMDTERGKIAACSLFGKRSGSGDAEEETFLGACERGLYNEP